MAEKKKKKKEGAAQKLLKKLIGLDTNAYDDTKEGSYLINKSEKKRRLDEASKR